MKILVADPKGHRTVSEVAYEVGFKNVSTSRGVSAAISRSRRADIRQVNNAFCSRADFKLSRPKAALASKAPPPRRPGSAYWETNKRRPVQETV